MPSHDHVHREVVVDRRPGPLAIIAGVVLAALLIFGVWYYFIADDDTRDDVLPDDIDVTVDQ